MENPELEEKKEPTITVEMTVMEAMTLSMNLMVLGSIAQAQGIPMLNPPAMQSFLKKFEEANSAAKQSAARKGRSAAGSDGSTSSGEPAGADQVPVPEA